MSEPGELREVGDCLAELRADLEPHMLKEGRVLFPMIRELAITASLGVGYKIITNLVMLPVAASCFNFTREYADKAMKKREQKEKERRRKQAKGSTLADHSQGAQLVTKITH